MDILCGQIKNKNEHMKWLLSIVLLLSAAASLAQNVAGLWRGRFTTGNMLQVEMPYKFELLLFQNGDSISGYSYSTISTADYYAVCEVTGMLYDGYMVVTEKNTLYQNPSTPEGVMQSHILFLSSGNSEATGDWKQTNKRDFQLLPQQGKTFLKKEDDPSQSGLIKILEKKNAIKITDPNKPALVNTDSVKLASRQKEMLQTIETNADSVVLELYDDGLLDGDSVSVFLNNTLLLNKVLLSDKAIKQTIHLPVTKEAIVISMFAENQGSIPPNTGLLIIREGDKKYEIRFSSDTKKSAAVMLRRK